MSGASLPCGVCSLRDAACGPTGRYPVDRVGAVFDSFLEMRKVARPGRFELPTLCLEGRRSIRLSYGRLIHSRGFPAPGTTHLYVNQPVRAESWSRHNSLSMRVNPRDSLSEFDSRYLFLECLAGG